MVNLPLAPVGGVLAIVLTHGVLNVATLWGTIATYDQHDYLKMDFHVPHPSETDPGFTCVEVRFTVVWTDRTRVDLSQSNWEGLGDSAEMAKGGYRHAWGVILAGYTQA
jgi:hypothetical protein